MNKALVYLAVGCVGLAAQTGKTIDMLTLEGPPGSDFNGQTLQEKYHIAATEEGLIGALQHQEWVVRRFAAVWLGARGDKAAIPPILAALAAETDEYNKIILATSAAKLGAAEGVGALKNICDDRSSSQVQRMSAAQNMLLDLGRQDCLSDILEVLWLPTDHHGADSMALGLLSNLKQIPPSQLDEIRNMSTVYLKSHEDGVRMAASHLTRILGGPWAVSQLQAALDAEREESVRQSIASDLSSLQK